MNICVSDVCRWMDGCSDPSMVHVVNAELKRNQGYLNRTAGPGAAGDSAVRESTGV